MHYCFAERGGHEICAAVEFDLRFVGGGELGRVEGVWTRACVGDWGE